MGKTEREREGGEKEMRERGERLVSKTKVVTINNKWKQKE